MPSTTSASSLPASRPSRVVVEAVAPVVDGGAFPAKATVGETVTVTADVVEGAVADRTAAQIARRILLAHGIAAADVIKIDTEGAEWEILTSIDRTLLSQVRVIMGELHGRRDFELLDYYAHGSIKAPIAV